MPEAIPTILRIVALDLSLNSTGVASTNDWQNHVDTWAIKHGFAGMERLKFVRDVIRKIVSGPTDPADLVAIEEQTFATNKSFARENAGLAALVKMDLYEAGIPFVLVIGTQVKKYATGNGSADKDAVFQAAIRRGNREFGCKDESDAWWLHQMASAHYGLPHVPMPALNRAVLDKIAWPTLTLEVVA